MTEREKLIEELNKKYGQQFPMYVDRVAEILIADRLRVVEPLVKYIKDGNSGGTLAMKAMNQTLKLAGAIK